MNRATRIVLAGALGLALVLAAGCASTSSVPKKFTLRKFHHVAGLDCTRCHEPQSTQWSSAEDLHAASAATILGVKAHNNAEVPKDDCLLCHSMFQAVGLHATVDPTGTASGTKVAKSAYGPVDDPAQTYYSGAVSHFITPVTAKGPWTITNASEWQATKCEVCHDPSSGATAKLAKYGAWLDSQPTAGYIQLDTGMPVAYAYLYETSQIKRNQGDYVRTDYKDQSAISVHGTKLCDSCHDPDDQGGDPAKVVSGRNYGPQGGDSRSYMTANHANLGCIDCHKGHTFAPETSAQAATDTKCIGMGCHNVGAPAPRTATDPGVVHTNHIP
jgi:hypothetical protein